MNTPAPNPARFDGHWLTPRHMAALAGIGAARLNQLVLAGVLPAGAARQPGGHGTRREYDAGAVLRWRQERTDRRRRP